MRGGMETAEMSPSNERFVWIAFCGLIVLLSVCAIASAVLTDLIWNIDGLMLVLACLAIGGLFSLFLFFVLKDAGWLPKRKRSLKALEGADAPPAEDAK